MQKLSDCPQALHVRAFLDGANEAFLLLDLCRSNLMDYVSSRGPAAVPAALSVFESICRAVRHMHEMNPPLAHRHVFPRCRHPRIVAVGRGADGRASRAGRVATGAAEGAVRLVV